MWDGTIGDFCIICKRQNRRNELLPYCTQCGAKYHRECLRAELETNVTPSSSTWSCVVCGVTAGININKNLSVFLPRTRTFSLPALTTSTVNLDHKKLLANSGGCLDLIGNLLPTDTMAGAGSKSPKGGKLKHVDNEQLLNAINKLENKIDSVSENFVSSLERMEMKMQDLETCLKRQEVLSTKQVTLGISSEKLKEMDSIFEKLNERIKQLELDKIRMEKLLETGQAEQTEALQYLRGNNMIVAGIPYVDGENLKEIFGLICKRIDYKLRHDAVEVIHRLWKKSPLFIVRLRNKDDRRSIMITKRKFGTVTAMQIDKRYDQNFVFLNEDLTRATRVLLNSAKRLKKEFNYHHCYVENGKVYLRKLDGGERLRVFSESQLRRLWEDELESPLLEEEPAVSSTPVNRPPFAYSMIKGKKHQNRGGKGKNQGQQQRQQGSPGKLHQNKRARIVSPEAEETDEAPQDDDEDNSMEETQS